MNELKLEKALAPDEPTYGDGQIFILRGYPYKMIHIHKGTFGIFDLQESMMFGQSVKAKRHFFVTAEEVQKMFCHPVDDIINAKSGHRIVAKPTYQIGVGSMIYHSGLACDANSTYIILQDYTNEAVRYMALDNSSFGKVVEVNDVDNLTLEEVQKVFADLPFDDLYLLEHQFRR